MSGPGTELKYLLKTYLRINTSKACDCNKRAAEMDRNGVEWCRENIDTIVGWLEDAAKRDRRTFSRVGAKTLARWAIRRATSSLSRDAQS